MRWDELERFLLDRATEDLLTDGDIRPCLAAFEDDDALLLASLRSFAKGAYAQPVIEVLALALSLHANRVALCVGGRAWSLDDPVPPVVAGVADLRQRVAAITTVDGMAADVIRAASIHPFDLRRDEVAWGPPIREAEQSWLGDALEAGVRHRHEFTADADAARDQAVRCAALGHALAFAPAVAARLDGVRSVNLRRC